MNTLSKCLLGLAVGVCLSNSAFANTPLTPINTIAFWNQDDVGTVDGSSSIPQPPPYSHDPNVTVSNLTAHGAVVGINGSNALTFKNWGTSIDPNNYVGFTVTPMNGNQMVLSSLNFIKDQFTATSFVWAYRIDEGTGFGPWVYATSYTTAVNANGLDDTTWTFPTPIVTGGTVEFGYFASAAAVTSRLPVGNPLLLGTAGDHVVDPTLGQGVISSYTDASTYTTPDSEASALTWDTDTKSFFEVGDENGAIVEVDKFGQELSIMSMSDIKFPVTNVKGDPEGLAYLGKDANGKPSLLIAAEREDAAFVLSYNAGGANTPNWETTTPLITFGFISPNQGLEGVSPDPTDGSVWGLKQMKTVGVLHAINVGTANQVVVPIDMNDINWRIGLHDIDDIYVMANSAAYANSDHLLILSETTNVIVEITKTGKVVDVLDISAMGFGVVEGITMDDDGVLYLCSEQQVGANAKVYKPAFHVLTKAKNSVKGTGGRQTIVGTAGDDEIYGNEAADTLTGNGGKNTFVFKSLRDGIDTITDFKPGQDVIDISAVLDSVGYTGNLSNPVPYGPLVDGEVRLVDSSSGAVLQILSAGSYRSLAILKGLTAAQVTLTPDNFHFLTAKLTQGTWYKN